MDKRLCYMVLCLAAMVMIFGAGMSQAEQETCCPYPNLFTEREMANEGRTYQAIDEYQHIVIGWAEDLVRCRNCGWWEYVSTDVEMSEAEDHDFWSDGCYNCGYECLHASVETVQSLDYRGREFAEGYKCEMLDEVYHVETVSYVELERCSVCYDTLSEKRLLPVSETTTGLHYFEDGECRSCGYSGECVHPEAWVDYYTTDEVCEPISVRQHKITGKMYCSIYCNQCHTQLPDELLFENSVSVYDHFFKNGVCESCGYVNTCVHTNTKTEQYMSEPVYYLPLNDTCHQEIGEIHERVYCMDCEEKLSDKLIAETSIIERKHDIISEMITATKMKKYTAIVDA